MLNRTGLSAPRAVIGANPLAGRTRHRLRRASVARVPPDRPRPRVKGPGGCSAAPGPVDHDHVGADRDQERTAEQVLGRLAAVVEVAAGAGVGPERVGVARVVRRGPARGDVERLTVVHDLDPRARVVDHVPGGVSGLRGGRVDRLRDAEERGECHHDDDAPLRQRRADGAAGGGAGVQGSPKMVLDFRSARHTQ